MTRHVQPIGVRLAPDGTVDTPPQPGARIGRLGSYTSAVNNTEVDLNTVDYTTDPDLIFNTGNVLLVRTPGIYTVTANIWGFMNKTQTVGTVPEIQAFIEASNGITWNALVGSRASTYVLVTGPTSVRFALTMSVQANCVETDHLPTPTIPQAFRIFYLFNACDTITISEQLTTLAMTRLTPFVTT